MISPYCGNRELQDMGGNGLATWYWSSMLSALIKGLLASGECWLLTESNP